PRGRWQIALQSESKRRHTARATRRGVAGCAWYSSVDLAGERRAFPAEVFVQSAPFATARPPSCPYIVKNISRAAKWPAVIAMGSRSRQRSCSDQPLTGRIDG